MMDVHQRRDIDMVTRNPLDRIGTTPKNWLPVGKQIQDLARKWSGENDIMTYIGPGAAGSTADGRGGIAMFNRTMREVEINRLVAFGKKTKPEDIDLTSYKGRYRHPKAVGALYHEASHAEHSGPTHTLRDQMTPEEAAAVVLLEESRVEYKMLKKIPRSKPFLRACTMDMVLSETDPITGEERPLDASTARGAAQYVGLVHARVDAGILEAEEVTAIFKLVEDVLGEERVEKLREIAILYQEHDPYEHEYRWSLAKRWVEIVTEARQERDEKDWDEMSPEEQQAAMEMAQAIGQAMQQALEEAGGVIKIHASKELIGAEAAEDTEARMDAERDAEKERAKSEQAANEIFGDPNKPPGMGVSLSGKNGRSTGSVLESERAPSYDEQSAAAIVAKLLERARYRERAVSTYESEVPPGRLRASRMMQREAQESRGIRSEINPYKHKKRTYTDSPPLTVGIIRDVSGSMGYSMEPMGVAAYVMSEACRIIGARTAMLGFGHSVFPIAWPGERVNSIKVYTAPDGYEAFDMAFRAIDGKLNLLHGEGARLLFIVSDCGYKGEEQAAALHWMAECRRHGVAVVWVPFKSGQYVEAFAGEDQKVLELDPKLPLTDAAVEIGRACAEVLSKT